MSEDSGTSGCGLERYGSQPGGKPPGHGRLKADDEQLRQLWRENQRLRAKEIFGEDALVSFVPCDRRPPKTQSLSAANRPDVAVAGLGDEEDVAVAHEHDPGADGGAGARSRRPIRRRLHA